MKNKIEKIINAWKDKYGDSGNAYSLDRIAEIATNCVSLSNVWLKQIKSNKGVSLELTLFNKDGVACETLHGVTEENLPDTMVDILVNQNHKYSKIALNYFSYENDRKISNLIGELEIS